MKKIIYILIISMAWVIKARGQDLEYIQYTTEDGLPSMETYNIMQDKSGLIWVGTENGLVSFDGENFTTYTSAEFKDKEIIEAVMDSYGLIFFSTLNKEIGIFENGKMRKLDIEIPSIARINLYCHNDKILLYINDFSLKKRYDDSLKEVFEIKKGDNNNYTLEPTKISKFVFGEELTFFRKDRISYRSTKDSSTTLTYASPDKCYYSKDQYFLPLAPAVSSQIHRLDKFIFDRFDNVKFRRFIPHSEENAFIINTKGFDYFDVKSRRMYSFFPDLVINTLFVDEEENVWISTPNKGLIRVPQLFNKVSQEEGSITIDDGINDIYFCDDGAVLLGTLSSEVLVFANKNLEKHTLSEYNKPVFFVDAEDKVYPYEYREMASIDKGSLDFIKVKRPPSKTNKLLLIDSSFYVARNNGISIYTQKDFFSPENLVETIAYGTPRVLDMFFDESSNLLYVGTPGGLMIFNDGMRHDVKNNLLLSEVITSINPSEDNALWIGTQGAGVVKFENGEVIKKYDTENGLISDRVNRVEQFNNQLLVSTVRGLSIINVETGEIKSINESNFLTSNEVLVSKYHEGKYWIGTRDKLSIIDKNDVESYRASGPKTSLKDFIVNGVNFAYEKDIKLRYNENNIQINLQNISFKSGRDKFIKYRLPLQDTSWILTSDPSIRLPSLKPGRYKFEAVGINSVGLASDPVLIDFFIDTPWWKESWVFILGLIALAGIVYFIFRYSLRQEREKRDYLVQINKIKDQALQLQMNPHFIFNSLNAIQGFIGTDDEEQAMNFLARFARLIRLIFEHSKGSSISLEEELEFLQLYLDLEKLRFKNKVSIELKIDKELEMQKDVIHVPPLLIQPIVENSFKHGLFHKKGVGNLKVEYTLQGHDTLKVIIEDDGIGRKKASQIARNNSNQKSSSGIKTTQERIDILNFNSNVKNNEMRIEDLHDNANNSLGTKTIITLSIHSN